VVLIFQHIERTFYLLPGVSRDPWPFAAADAPDTHRKHSRDIGGIGSVLESSRRVAVRAASSAVDHLSSVLVNPHTWSGVSPSS
jgi:hypothetical protein